MPRAQILSVVLVVTSGLTAFARDPDFDLPTHSEVDPIRFEIGPNGKIETMAMDRKGRLLCGVSWTLPRPATAQKLPRAAVAEQEPDPRFQRPRRRPGLPPNRNNRRPPVRRRPGNVQRELPRDYAIKVVTGDGKVLETWPMKHVHPKMIHGASDGTVYVGGHGKLGRFSADGKLLAQVKLSEILDGAYARADVSGVTANEKYFFVAFGNGFSLRATEDIVRFNRDFSEPKLIVQKQFGCCAHIDLDTKDGLLLIAENSRHRVNRFDFEGERQDTWGRRDRESLEGFAACCNPVNFDFGPKGILYTAESGVGRVKRYTADGKYLGMVGYVDTTKFDRGSRLASQSCYIPVEVNHDASRIYVMDVRAHIIRVLAENAENTAKEASE